LQQESFTVSNARQGALEVARLTGKNERRERRELLLNVVERRNREAWKLSEAVANLGATTLRMLSEL